jgi:hypothetical protein
MDTTWTRTETPARDAKVGDVVSYSDISNPASFNTIVELVTDAWGTEARMVDLATGRIHTASLRGAGWRMAKPTLAPGRDLVSELRTMGIV